MGVVKINQSFKTKVSPDRMFKALILDADNLCPNLMFSSIKSIEVIEGNGDVGTIKQMNFAEAITFTYVKSRMDVLDKENLMCKYTLIEGDVLMDKLESIVYEIRFEPYGLTGCVVKVTSEYYPKENVEITKEEIELGPIHLSKAIGMYEIVEAHLLAHPRAYT